MFHKVFKFIKCMVCAYLEHFQCINALYCKRQGCQVCQWWKLQIYTCVCMCVCVCVCVRACVCVWDLTSVWAPNSWVTAELHSGCVSAHGHCWQTGHTGRAGGGCGHAILSPDSGQTWHRPLTQGEGVVWRGGQAAGVYVDVYGICLYACL